LVAIDGEVQPNFATSRNNSVLIEDVVARDGIEPPTPAFSGLTSSTLNLLKTNKLAAFLALKKGLQLQPIATIGLVLGLLHSTPPAMAANSSAG